MSIIHYLSPTFNDDRVTYSKYENYIKANFIGKPAPFFISDWNSDYAKHPLNKIINIAYTNSLQHIDHYYSCSNNYCQEIIADIIFKNYDMNIATNQVTIGNNATSLLSFCIQTLLFHGINNYLAIAPTYFSVIDAITLGNGKVTIVQPTFPRIAIDIDEIEFIISTNNIQALIITDPYFGFGTKIENNEFMLLLDIAQKYGCTIICDFARYGLDWDNNIEPFLFNDKLKYFNKVDKFALIYSPCKKYFANGIKTAIMLTSKNICETVSDYSDSFLGSISSPQIAFLNSILNKTNSNKLQSYLSSRKMQVLANFDKISSVVLGGNLFTVRPNTGNYMVIGIDKIDSDYTTFKRIASYYGINTLPLSLYHFFNSEKYLFRVNLLLDTIKLLNAVSSLQEYQNKNSSNTPII